MLKPRRITGLLAVTALLTLLAPGAAHAQKLLRWKFQPGETVKFAMTQDMNQTLTMAGNAPPITMTTTQQMDITWHVKSVDSPERISLTQTFDRAKIKTQSPQGVLMEYDTASGKPAEGLAQMAVPMYDAIIGKEIRMVYTDRGVVTEMTLPPGMLEAINKTAGSGQGNLFSEDWMRQMAETVILPKDPVTPGQTWSHEFALQNTGTGAIKSTTTFRYEGTEKRNGKMVEKISLVSKFDIKGGDKAEIGIKEQASEGTIYFDNEAGRSVEVLSKTRMKMDIEMMGQRMSQDMVLNAVVKFQPTATARRTDKR